MDFLRALDWSNIDPTDGMILLISHIVAKLSADDSGTTDPIPVFQMAISQNVSNSEQEKQAPQRDDEHPANGCMQFVKYLLVGSGVFFGLIVVLFTIHQVFSGDRWRGEAIGFLIGNVVVGAILLAVPIIILAVTVGRARKRNQNPK